MSKPKLTVVKNGKNGHKPSGPKGAVDDTAATLAKHAGKLMSLDGINDLMMQAEVKLGKGDEAGAGSIYELIAQQKHFPRKAMRARQALAALLRNGAREIQELDAIETEEDDELGEERSEETDAQVAERLNERFEAYARMVRGVMRGVVPSMIGAGPAGLGKSYTVEEALAEMKEENPLFKYDYIKGAISLVGLFQSAWEHREKGQVIILDDVDAVFADEDILNILKAMLDSNARRTISYRKQAKWLDDLGIDQTFDFYGSVIFLSNKDFEKIVESKRANAPHFKALMDRSLYLHLTIRTVNDVMVRIRQVVEEGKMLEKPEYQLTTADAKEIMQFVSDNRHKFYHLSLRLIHQIALMRRNDPVNWKKDVRMTKCRPESL